MQAEASVTAAAFPVLICGAGPVGSVLALALASAGQRVGLVQAHAVDALHAAPHAAPRPIALSAASVRILRTLGVWNAIAPEACPIRMVHVGEQGRFGMVRLRARDLGVDALGQVVDAGVIARVLDAAVSAEPGITCIGPAQVLSAETRADLLHAQLDVRGLATPCARLLVVADGGVSRLGCALGIATRRRDYRQYAVLATVTPGRAHDCVAYERFTPDGPIAMLPLVDGRCALVWTLPEARARSVAAMAEREFLAALQRSFGRRLGVLRAAAARSSFELALVRSRALSAHRVVLIGNAANRLHPVAGQGLNLGLRDAAVLADLVAEAVRAGHDAGSDTLLARYRALRAADHRAVVLFTDALARGFTSGPTALGSVRSAAMLALDLVPPASRALARRAMGLAGRQPRLVRGITP